MFLQIKELCSVVFVDAYSHRLFYSLLYFGGGSESFVWAFLWLPENGVLSVGLWLLF